MRRVGEVLCVQNKREKKETVHLIADQKLSQLELNRELMPEIDRCIN